MFLVLFLHLLNAKPLNAFLKYRLTLNMTWYYKRWSVIGALILLGPFAFPLLWKSPELNLAWKIALTVILPAATIYMIAGTWKIFELLIREIRQMKDQGIL